MIRLDWDNCAYEVMLKRLEAMKKSKYIQAIEVRASPSLDGYHCLVSTFGKIPKQYEYFLRSEWWDDPIRLKNDMLVWGSLNKARNVLFQKKIYKNMEFKEISMMLVSRPTKFHKWNEKVFDNSQTILEEF